MVYFHATDRPDDGTAAAHCQKCGAVLVGSEQRGTLCNACLSPELRYSDDTRTALNHLRNDVSELHARIHSMMYAPDVIGPEHKSGDDSFHELGTVWNELHAASNCLNAVLHLVTNATKETRS